MLDEKKRISLLFFYVTIILIIFFLTIVYYKTFQTKQIEEKTPTEKRYGVILAGYEGFYIYDIIQQDIVSLHNTGQYVNDAKIIGNYLYLVDRSGVKIYDFSNPLEPVLVNSYSTFGTSLSITLVDKTVYVADGQNGLVIFELDDDIYLKLKNHLILPGIITQIEIYENYLFALGPGLGLKVFKIKEGFNLEEINSYNEFVSPRMMTLSNEFLIINDDLIGILLFKISDLIKSKNVDLKLFSTLNYKAFSISCIDDVLYFSTNTGIYIINFSTQEIKEIVSNNFSRANITVYNNMIYLCNNEDGLYVYELDTGNLIKRFNIVNFINDFIVLDEGILIDDGLNLVFLNYQKEKVFEQEYLGRTYKGKNGFYIIKDNVVSFFNPKNTLLKEFPEEILNVRETEKDVYAIGKENVYSFLNEDVIFNEPINDIENVNNSYFLAQDNKILEYNPKTKNVYLRYSIKEQIKAVNYSKNQFLIITDNGIYKLNSNFELLDYYNFLYIPDIILNSEQYIFLSIGQQITIIDKSNFNLFKDINLGLPILGMSIKDNILYISFASKGITSYEIGSNFEFNKIEDVLYLFNPKKFII
jgi:hypothetical protein